MDSRAPEWFEYCTVNGHGTRTLVYQGVLYFACDGCHRATAAKPTLQRPVGCACMGAGGDYQCVSCEMAHR